MNQNLSTDEQWARAAEAVESIVGSKEPLVSTSDTRDAPAKNSGKRRALATPLGLTLFFASSIAVAFALYPAVQNGAGDARSWQSAHE